VAKQTNSRQANRVVSGMVPAEYDRVDYTEPTTSSEKYAFYLDSVLVGVVTLTYTDATKATLDQVLRTNEL
jgi:hypothetical protein